MTQTLKARAPHLPGEAGVWVFILGDMAMFAALFITFVYYRRADVAGFVHSQHALNQQLGALNTFFMLTSSWCVALAVHAARAGLARRAQGWLLAGMACAVSFVVVKFFEYSEKIAAGITLTSNDFFMYYYMLTGLHLLHVLLGLGVLSYLWRSLCAPAGHSTLRTLESGACFWHMVDILWIVLFALLYMLR
ncbi:MAG: cytochrome c oxidase subunit 3 family protein [Gammaproteobacteria bacterium]|nr:cytochrome c oxidase subunit 3 family protein [Gammaproteobacteria bacterium]